MILFSAAVAGPAMSAKALRWRTCLAATPIERGAV